MGVVGTICRSRLSSSPLTVFKAVRDHGAVEIEQTRCRRNARRKPRCRCARRSRPGPVFDRPARRRTGSDRQDDLGTFARREVEIGAGSGTRTAISTYCGIAIKRPRPIAKAGGSPASAPAKRCWSHASSLRSESASPISLSIQHSHSSGLGITARTGETAGSCSKSDYLAATGPYHPDPQRWFWRSPMGVVQCCKWCVRAAKGAARAGMRS